MSDTPQQQVQQTWLEHAMEPRPEHAMEPRPDSAMARYRAANRLANKAALISGGDSGIGRAVAIGFAKEGAHVAITYLDEHDDAAETVELIEAEGRRALAIPGDIGNSDFCREAARQAVAAFGRIDILVNNAAEQHPVERLEELSDEQIERTFRTNIFGQFFLTRAVLPHMPDGGAIVNTASVTAYQGNPVLLDYGSSNGAIVAFTRSLAKQLLKRGIRVNGVAPGPNENAPMERAGQPDAVAPCYIFLASQDASYMTGQVLHPNGGTAVNG